MSEPQTTPESMQQVVRESIADLAANAAAAYTRSRLHAVDPVSHDSGDAGSPPVFLFDRDNSVLNHPPADRIADSIRDIIPSADAIPYSGTPAFNDLQRWAANEEINEFIQRIRDSVGVPSSLLLDRRSNPPSLPSDPPGEPYFENRVTTLGGSASSPISTGLGLSIDATTMFMEAFSSTISDPLSVILTRLADADLRHRNELAEMLQAFLFSGVTSFESRVAELEAELDCLLSRQFYTAGVDLAQPEGDTTVRFLAFERRGSSIANPLAGGRVLIEPPFADEGHPDL